MRIIAGWPLQSIMHLTCGCGRLVSGILPEALSRSMKMRHALRWKIVFLQIRFLKLAGSVATHFLPQANKHYFSGAMQSRASMILLQDSALQGRMLLFNVNLICLIVSVAASIAGHPVFCSML